VGQRKLARVSKRPGRTQEINFFLIDDRVAFADLPGYGFARVPKPIQEQWKGLVEGFLASRRDLRLVIVLIDARRGLQTADRQLLGYLASLGRRTLVVATKADKLTRSARKQFADELAAEELEQPPLICSAVSGEGIGDLWRRIDAAVAGAQPGHS
jgi:GTP-binding protein